MKSELFTESFDQFASRVSTTDLALYAGAGIILWVLFKDKLSPVQKFLGDIFSKIRTPSISALNLTTNTEIKNINNTKTPDVFFELVSSWKQTRDLAVKSGCEEAVKVADEMFPYLSPHGCAKEEVKS